MALVVVVVILIIWAGYGFKQALTPRTPPIENLDEHIKTITQMDSQKERKKFLKQHKKY